MFPRSALPLYNAKNFLCFHHGWGLPPNYVTDNGGNVGGDVPSLSQDEEKDAKDATSCSKAATLDEKVASLEPKDAKVKKTI